MRRAQTLVAESPAGTTREQAEEARRMFLETDGCLGARLEEVE